MSQQFHWHHVGGGAAIPTTRVVGFAQVLPPRVVDSMPPPDDPQWPVFALGGGVPVQQNEWIYGPIAERWLPRLPIRQVASTRERFDVS